MGNTCKPMAVSFQCMTKFTTKKKKQNTEMAREMTLCALPRTTAWALAEGKHTTLVQFYRLKRGRWRQQHP